ncbi:MAG: PASTA domain-containing protein, partial [Longimicrobiales bacterium]
ADPTVLVAQAGPPSEPVIFTLDRPRRPRPGSSVGAAARLVPRVAGLSLRDAARRLHLHGFRVTIHGGGTVTETLPAAGAAATRGTVVLVFAQDGSP